MNHGHKKPGLSFTPEQLIEKVKKIMTEDLPTSDTNDLAKDIFNFVKDGKKFAEDFVGAVTTTEIKTGSIAMLVDLLINNTEMREKSTEWREYLNPHLFRISQYVVDSPKTKVVYTTNLGKWIKKKMFVGELLDQLSGIFSAEDDNVSGKKRKREDPEEGDEKILKKQKV